MLLSKYNNCNDCNTIDNLILEIDCKLIILSNVLYNNTIFLLNKSFSKETMFDLLMYKQILIYIKVDPEYTNYTLASITSKIKILKFK